MFDEFYDREFASLKQATSANPLARPLMENLFQERFRVAIATNPIFPERAIRERLRWLEIDNLPYDLVTAYETMHFCKPNPDYYTEVLELLEVAPGDCLMIGNDVEEDLSAGSLGHQNISGGGLPPEPQKPAHRGRLPWLLRRPGSLLGDLRVPANSVPDRSPADIRDVFLLSLS